MSEQRRKDSFQKWWTLALCTTLACSTVGGAQRVNARRSPQSDAVHLRLPKIPDRKPRNVIFVLTDDQRYDALGFKPGQSFFGTPNLDALARSGVYLPNAFVTTALCSP